MRYGFLETLPTSTPDQNPKENNWKLYGIWITMEILYLA
jgi:hypothetical protein